MTRTGIAAVVLAALLDGRAAAQTLTGTIGGRVVDQQQAVIPGVAVTLTGRWGPRTVTTDDLGRYLFLGLDPGVYSASVQQTGFVGRTQDGLVLRAGESLEVAFTLVLAGLAESVTVAAEAPAFDVTTAAMDFTLTQDLLFNMPINLGTFNAAEDLLNYAPGITAGSAYAGDQNAGSALLIDGVDTRDPQAGFAWVFYNFNNVEAVQVIGLGAPAEYGGFTGAVVNTITKSGGNRHSALFDLHYTNDDLASSNIDEDVLNANPTLSDQTVVNELVDYTVQIGGPLKRDRAFYWGSAQRLSLRANPRGPRTRYTEVSPRYTGKLSLQPNPIHTLVGSLQWDSFNVTGREGLPGVTLSTDRQTVQQDSPETVWSLQYRTIVGPSALFEARYTGYTGSYYLDPVDPAAVHLDIGTGGASGGAGSTSYSDRSRHQLNASLSVHAAAHGLHQFKMGFEVERSAARDRVLLSEGVRYFDQFATPFVALSDLQKDIDASNRRSSAYVQDAWQVGRVTASFGLRLDHIRGASPARSEDIYTPGLAWGPRLGVALDVAGNGAGVLRGFYGRHYEGAALSPYERAVPGYEDAVTYLVLPGGQLQEVDRVPELVYDIDSDIDHYGFDEAGLGWEQRLRGNLRLSLAGTWREHRNFIASLRPSATWEPFTMANPLTGQPLTLYRWANRAEADEDYLIANVAGFEYRDPGGGVLAVASPERSYRSLIVVVSRPLTDRWQGRVSYVWSRARGNVGNASREAFGGIGYEDPNLAVASNAQGRMESERAHELKLFGGYEIPVVDVSLNAYYEALSGQSYTPVMTVSGALLNVPGAQIIYLEPRGARRNQTQHRLDLNVEKVLRADVHRLGIYVAFQNLLNSDTVLAVQGFYPSRAIAGTTVAFEAPTAVASPRQVTIGARWSF